MPVGKDSSASAESFKDKLRLCVWKQTLVWGKGIEEWPVKAVRGLRLLCALAGVPRLHWGHGAGNILGAHWRDELCWLAALGQRGCSAFFLLCKRELPSIPARPSALVHRPAHMHPCTTCSPPCPAWHNRTHLSPTQCPHPGFLWGDFSLKLLLQPRSRSTAGLGLANLGQPA